MKHVLTSLFNNIYDRGCYPDQWCTGVIVPIYKHGDHKLASNYIGITLTSTLSKLFTYVLNKRLGQWSDEHGILSRAQFAYKSGSGASDAIFVLHSVLSHGLKNGNVFCAFIDFSKAFDNIDREILVQQLKHYGISTKFLNVLLNMYSKLMSNVKTQEGISLPFRQSKGVMQGECLSPTMFAIYINELEHIMNDINQMGIVLGNTKISILKYADDLVLLSTSTRGLQKGLDALHMFCDTNKLTVNTLKSKVMYVSSRTIKCVPVMSYHGNNLEWVDNFNYLGVTFSRNNRFYKGLKTKCQVANKSKVVIDIHVIKHPTLPLTHIFEIFDSLLKPKVLYGCETWGIDNYKEIELFHLRFIKQALHVKSTTNTCMLYAETGRYPLSIDINIRMVKYWIKLMNSDQRSLMHIVYQELVKNPGESTWANHIQQLLRSSGFGYAWGNQHIDNERVFLNMFAQRSRDMYIQGCMSELAASNRCRTYRAIKLEFGAEPYMSCNISSTLRTAYTKLRLSSHTLMVERGRWSKPMIPYEQRKCTLCNNGDIEDEFHIVLICAYFHQLRGKYIKQYYYSRPSMHKFVCLMNTNNTRDRFRLMVFMKLAFREYNDSIRE